jgi:serine/threonine protein kinase
MHRDLKPDNILIHKENGYSIIKISDYGLARKVDDAGFGKTLCGTVYYMVCNLCNVLLRFCWTGSRNIFIKIWLHTESGYVELWSYNVSTSHSTVFIFIFFYLLFVIAYRLMDTV